MDQQYTTIEFALHKKLEDLFHEGLVTDEIYDLSKRIKKKIRQLEVENNQLIKDRYNIISSMVHDYQISLAELLTDPNTELRTAVERDMYRNSWSLLYKDTPLAAKIKSNMRSIVKETSSPEDNKGDDK